MPVFSDQIIVYDFNAALKTNSELATVAGSTMDIFPLVAPSGQTPPFLIYYWVPGHIESSSYTIREDTIRYHIYDSQADRCFRIANKIISMFDVGGGQRGPGTDTTVTSTTNTNNVKNRILGSRLLRSRTTEPLEKEGWYAIQLDFSVMYVTD
jgi:hypothetical protein|tara:strand:- start:12 stop:470 length:459 start_codon:yes stop_codon:yes gene_type:complete